MQPYMSYTVHYINSMWEPKCHTLKTHYLPEDHTGENIKVLSTTLNEWNLPEQKQVVITTDSGSNIVRACHLGSVSAVLGIT